MRLISKKEINNPLTTPQGEIIFELIGKHEQSGGSSKHSLAQVIIPPGNGSSLHYHKNSEETYYILEGEGWMRIDHQEFSLQPGQACLIEPGELHQIKNQGKTDLKFLAICAPAWVSDDSFEMEG